MKSIIRRAKQLRKRFRPESERPVLELYLTSDDSSYRGETYDYSQARLLQDDGVGVRTWEIPDKNGDFHFGDMYENPDSSKNEESKVT